MESIDISMPLFRGMPAFPGDPPFASDPIRSIARGDAYNISTVSLGTHAGTHVDPPVHFLSRGPPIDAIDLGALNGPCWVVDLTRGPPSLGAAEVAGVPSGEERILFRTANSERWARRLEFFSDYVALAAAAADEIVARGPVRLVGIDSLSIESDPSGAFPVHHALLGAGILILEGLLLDGVPSGPYELRCLPLRLRGGDGGPARAVLLPRAPKGRSGRRAR